MANGTDCEIRFELEDEEDTTDSEDVGTESPFVSSGMFEAQYQHILHPPRVPTRKELDTLADSVALHLSVGPSPMQNELRGVFQIPVQEAKKSYLLDIVVTPANIAFAILDEMRIH